MTAEFQFILVTKKAILDAVRNAQHRLIYCAPSVDEIVGRTEHRRCLRYEA